MLSCIFLGHLTLENRSQSAQRGSNLTWFIQNLQHLIATSCEQLRHPKLAGEFGLARLTSRDGTRLLDLSISSHSGGEKSLRAKNPS